jgi:hypothetical protein
VSMERCATTARTAEEVASVRMGGDVNVARTVGGAASARTDGAVSGAGIAEAAAYVRTGAVASGARSVPTPPTPPNILVSS